MRFYLESVRFSIITPPVEWDRLTHLTVGVKMASGVCVETVKRIAVFDSNQMLAREVFVKVSCFGGAPESGEAPRFFRGLPERRVEEPSGGREREGDDTGQRTVAQGSRTSRRGPNPGKPGESVLGTFGGAYGRAWGRGARTPHCTDGSSKASDEPQVSEPWRAPVKPPQTLLSA